MVANCFADLFSNKIAKIHQGLGDLRASVGPTPYVDDICSQNSVSSMRSLRRM